jgi:hypothetical protein
MLKVISSLRLQPHHDTTTTVLLNKRSRLTVHGLIVVGIITDGLVVTPSALSVMPRVYCTYILRPCVPPDRFVPLIGLVGHCRDLDS